MRSALLVAFALNVLTVSCLPFVGRRVPPGTYALLVRGADTSVYYEGERVRGLRQSDLLEKLQVGETVVATYSSVWHVECWVVVEETNIGHGVDVMVRRFPNGVTDEILDKYFAPFREDLQQRRPRVDLDSADATI